MAQEQASVKPNAVKPPKIEEQSPATASLRGAIRVLWASGSGKAGLIFFALLTIVSIYVLLTYPIDFGKTEWSNPGYWSDNPKTAPPAWTTWLGHDAIEQQSANLTTPTDVTQRGAAEVRSFPFTIAVPGDISPTFLTMTLTGIEFNQRPPVIIVSMKRPDGTEVRLANISVQGPRPGETAPYQRYYDSPERVLLSQEQTAADSITQVYQQTYPTTPANDIGNNLTAALFGKPSSDGSGGIETLSGDYVVTAQVLVADPKDRVAGIDFVSGGNVYGVMGTDSIGRDLWRGLLYGFPVALLISVVTALATTFIGTTFGLISGYRAGKTDAVIQRSVDVLLNVPTLPLMIFLVFIFGAHLWLIMLMLVAFTWPGLTIIVRTMVLQIRSGQLVEAAQALGASRTRIMTRHLFPQIAPYVVAQMIFFAPGAILAEASLSFLGLGDPSIPTWGQMLEQGFQTGALYVGYWWWVLPPGILIIATAIVFMLLALGMEAVVDPRLRQRR
jgi:peptide/nickel transport system permease protein